MSIQILYMVLIELLGCESSLHILGTISLSDIGFAKLPLCGFLSFHFLGGRAAHWQGLSSLTREGAPTTQ